MHAVVVGAGVAVEVDGVAQVRPSSNVADYFEGKMQRLLASHPHGEVGDLEFEFEPDALLLPTFNDAIKLLRVQ